LKRHRDECPTGFGAEFIEGETCTDCEGVADATPLPPAGAQLDPTGDLAKAASPEELMSSVNVAKKNRWLGIFIQLSRSERFLKFVERNFVIQDRIDEEKKQISTVVFENPRAVGPDLTAVQKAKIYNLLKTYGARHPEKVFSEVLKTLGDEHVGVIPSATESDVKEAAKGADLKTDLD
jgi:hypothetical protein